MGEHIIETGLRKGEDIKAHGRFFEIRTADRSRFLAKGYLRPGGEIVLVSGVVPDDAQADLEALASEKPVATADTEPPPPIVEPPPPIVEDDEKPKRKPRKRKAKA